MNYKTAETYIFPGMLLIAGLGLLVFSLNSGQSAWFLIGGLALLITGVAAVLFQAGKLDKRMGTMLGLVFGVGAVALAYMNFRSIDDEMKLEVRKDLIRSHVIQGLKDIRTAQIAYRNTFGEYTDHPDSLFQFVKHGDLTVIKAIGLKPDTLTEEEAIELGIIKRDTILVNALDSLFLSPFVQEGRVYPFEADSFIYAPFSRKKFILRAGIVSTSGRNLPVFEAKDPKPFMTADTLAVGSMLKASTSGNWSGE